MISTVFRTTDVPTEDRFEYWRELMSRTIAPSEISSHHAADFRAEQRLMELGPVIVWSGEVLPTRYRRSPRLIRQSDPEQYHLQLLLGGGLGLDHVGRTDTYGPCDLWVSDSSRPYDVRPPRDESRHIVTGVAVELPKASLPLSPDQVRGLLGRRLSGREGSGALLTDFLIGLDRQSGVLRPSDTPRLSKILLDLVSVWFAQPLEAEAALPPETRQQALTMQIRAFIQENLHDPGLTPPVIAAAHHISLSYLHRLFQQWTRGETVAAWIRHERLERARHDLADPLQIATPIRTIAARWGLPRASDFTRAFRSAYGVSPREYRHQPPMRD
ncbi:helix-turn-helix domain-containing protein [Streptomyces sp. NPDC101455]|uniref:helix-turn-helix domain-containing protein n=1 Tax=Streptomyces sp. NPDC101455 TaxID=3366142 RepID=UPI0037F14742